MLEWLIGDPEPERVARAFYGDRVYEALRDAERAERERRKLVASCAFVDEAWPQMVGAATNVPNRLLLRPSSY